MSILIDFWCEPCHEWRRPAMRETNPRCTRCGEGFACGDCGYEIDMKGDCQRAKDGNGTCPSTSKAPGPKATP
jgi:hypothetical protein